MEFSSTSLPELYFAINSKRGLSVSLLRMLEKVCLKTAKKNADILFFQRCLHLEVCPRFLKIKPPKQYTDIKSIYKIMVKKTLNQSQSEVEKLKLNFYQLKENICEKLNCDEWKNLEENIQKQCNKLTEKVHANHTNKLMKLWIKQRPRSPDCIINLGDKN